ncbi:MAG: undecaprenyl diphosphate synthase family protein [Clostridium sp.]
MAEKNNIRVRMIGEKTVAPDIVGAINGLEERRKRMQNDLRDRQTEAVTRSRAVRKIMADCKDGKIAGGDDGTVFASHRRRGIPDPDLMIRTSEPAMQLSVMAARVLRTLRTELWPDFNKEELLNAIRQYNKRERRFGGVAAVKTE